MILAKEFEGEMWIKAAHHDQAVKHAVEAEREACADIAENWRCNGMPRTVLADQIRARGQDMKKYLAHEDAWRFIP